MNINQNSNTAYMSTPYDDQIAVLNDKLNATYVYYGATGEDRKQQQILQDKNAASYGLANIAERSFCKSSHAYFNNQCKARWTSYKTGKSKKCNWGDFRMPDSKELDTGAGDIYITEEYIHNGWQTFVATYNADNDKSDEAFKIERIKWWDNL